MDRNSKCMYLCSVSDKISHPLHMCLGAYKQTRKLNVNNDHALCNRLEFFEQFYNYVYQNTSRYSFEPV